MIKLILLALVIQYAVVFVKYKFLESYKDPNQFKNEMVPFYWAKVLFIKALTILKTPK